jgi:hypothetical protein
MKFFKGIYFNGKGFMKDRECKIPEKNSIRRPMVGIHSLLGIPQLKISEGTQKID